MAFRADNHLLEATPASAPRPTASETRTRVLSNTGAGSHVVQFYEGLDFLADCVADFAGAALGAGDPVLLVATPGHLTAIRARLEQRSFDVERAIRTRQLTLLDAERTLAKILTDGQPQWEAFRAQLGGVIRSMRRRRRDRTLRIYGEMVDLLCAGGNAGAAVQLEHMWNDLARVENFALLCGYGMQRFALGSSGGDFQHVCDAHEHVLPTEDFDLESGETGRFRQVSLLQQRARALETEIQRRADLEDELRRALAAVREREEAARRSEDAAQREREKLSRLFRQAPAMIVFHRGPTHVFEFLNAEASRIIAPSVLGKPFREAFPEGYADHLSMLDRVFQTGERSVGVEIPMAFTQNGVEHERFFNMVYEPYRNADERTEGVMSFGFEVTDQVLSRRKVEAVVQELEVAHRMKDDFLATISHELRTPLNAILGWARMLREGAFSEDKARRALETIERNARVQAQLIEDLLDVSRIISGKLRLEVAPVDVGCVVMNAVETVRPAASAKEITLRQSVDPDVGTIMGDANRLQQVVWNLLTNAVKFTNKGGSVEVIVERQDSSVMISVRDDGHGIDPEFLACVFERFRQAKTERRQGGLGLGLAIVRHLVELHGGTARAESGGLGKGATFTVFLPISAAQSASRVERPPALTLAPAPGPELLGALHGVRILVVDDESDARELLEEMLSRCHATVWGASSAEEALRLIEERRPDMLVSDVGMPGQDGYQLIQKVRALPADQGGRMPAVALTAYARVEDRMKALVAGFNMHVPKPVEPAELLAVLTNLTVMFPPEEGLRAP